MTRELKQEKFGKAKYKVGFLGYFDISWLYGRDLTDRALKDLLFGGSPNNPASELPRLSLTVDKKELKISQTFVNKNRKRKIRFPIISLQNVFWVHRGSGKDIEGIVGCIFYDSNNTGPTSWPITLHGYLFESVKLADRFAQHLQQLIDTAEHREMLLRKEKELVGSGVLIPHPRLPPGQFLVSKDFPVEDQVPPDNGNTKRRLLRTPFPESSLVASESEDPSGSKGSVADSGDSSGSDRPSKGGPGRLPRTVLVFEELNHVPDLIPSNDCHQHEANHRERFDSWNQEDPTYETVEMYSDEGESSEHKRLPRVHPTSSLAAEFKSKLRQGPILLPPKDYDTFSRTRGNMVGIEERKCLNPSIVGNGLSEG